MSCGANPQLNYIYKLITHDICKNSVALIYLFFFNESNTFTKQGCLKFKVTVKLLHFVTKDFSNFVLLNFLLIEESWKKY